MSDQKPRTDTFAPALPPSGPSTDSPPLPERIGRYRVLKALGKGGFGIVYLAQDEQLQRLVAIKVPHRKLVSHPEEANPYLTEARTVASLDHPNIVPVYDVGNSEDFPCYIVSKYIEGSTLTEKIKDHRFPFCDSAELVATVAEALHYAHRLGLVHRDIKPGNILLDTSGKPYVTDFGLALREERVGQGPRYCGTPFFMSPEQARGEGHRVEGRSDIFSLGVVFYQLLTGRRPFHADSRAKLLKQIATREPTPPRQWDDTIPKELERICLKALAKRVSERYTTGKDLAEDLRHFVNQFASEEKPTLRFPASVAESPAPALTLTPVAFSPPTPVTESEPIRIVPKGLRSFDGHDADFFLQLLPGPRDREGLPDSIRFWKTRIEETDPDRTFTVGLIYGPSGCGKSSLIKAGLLPRLGRQVAAVYVEATEKETETRLLRGLRRQVPDLPGNLDLVESMAALRQGEGQASGRKVLLVLDQLEQWLHGQRAEENTELVQALRQCDGGRVQCLVLVRDDFWMAVTRFLNLLEIELLQGRNCAAADLFDLDHTRKVLIAFGRALGKLPAKSRETSKEQKEFLEKAGAGLAQDGKVVCVRLALFAEIMKSRPWTPAALRKVGGTEGVGVTFLEETFSSPSANPKHRLHQKAVRSVLKTLLPESGIDIKGHMRSQAELLEASGYAGRPKDFHELVRILDREVRLLTPTDPEGQETAEDSRIHAPEGSKYYQLTHDFLVPALREWLTRKQKETRRGRAELRLAQRAALWTSKPENRHLPLWREWVNICLFTHKRDWTSPQRQMMRRATRYHLGWNLAVVAFLLLLLGGAWEIHSRTRAQALLDNLFSARMEDVPAIVSEMGSYHRRLDQSLRQNYADAERNDDRNKQLKLSLALLPQDNTQVAYLYTRLLGGSPSEVKVLGQALLQHEDRVNLAGELWALLKNPQEAPGGRLRAACGLAGYDPNNPSWEEVSPDVAAKLITENALLVPEWTALLQPVARFFLPPLGTFLEQEHRSGEERRRVAEIYQAFAGQEEDAYARLEEQLSSRQGPPPSKSLKLQANIAAALAAMGRGQKVWPLMAHSPDPTLRSYLIERLGPAGVEVGTLKSLLKQTQEPSLRQALILTLGSIPSARLSRAEQNELASELLDWHQKDPDAGIHAAAEWVLRRWGREEALNQLEQQWAQDAHGRQKRIERTQTLGTGQHRAGWFVNSQGQTMVVVRVPENASHKSREEYPGEPEARTVALGAKEVTAADFSRFRQVLPYGNNPSWPQDCPITGVTWYEAAAYCNWLSEKEGIDSSQWCYVDERFRQPRAVAAILGLVRPSSASVVIAGWLVSARSRVGPGMKLPADFLQRSGYRLPTEAEWDFACRAGARTRWSWGDEGNPGLGSEYAWTYDNLFVLERMRPFPVARLKPNVFGFFDMHGNVGEWCHDRQDGQGRVLIDDQDIATGVADERKRVQCGGSFVWPVNRESRFGALPHFPSPASGFRPARTLKGLDPPAQGGITK